MKLKTKLIYSGAVSAAALISSTFLPIIPCQTYPNVPNPIQKWTLCSLNPDQISALGSITKYFGYTSSLRDSYIITALITFIASMIFFHYIAGKKTKK